jgi:hypothetical protein
MSTNHQAYGRERGWRSLGAFEKSNQSRGANNEE